MSSVVSPRIDGRLRPQSRSNKCIRLRSLDCFEEVHQRLIEGLDLASIARYIQEEQKEYTDVIPAALITQLKIYKSTVPPGEFVNNKLPRFFSKAVSRLNKGVDEVKELENLVRFQKRRMQIDGKTEKQIRKLLPTMTQEVRVMAEVLRTLSNVKMDLGVSKRHLGQLDVDASVVAGVVERYGSESVAKVLQNPASRQKVLSVAEKFLALVATGEAANTVIDVTPEPESDLPETGESEEPTSVTEVVVEIPEPEDQK